MTPCRYSQIDVFTAEALLGNPLAVVHGAQGLDDARMAMFARWTNLSETAFLLPPTDAAADYRVRIFTPGRELPFAGHPTLGACHAWLTAGGVPRSEGEIVQQCGVGLVRLRRRGARLAFAAPPTRIAAADPATVALATQALGLREGQLQAAVRLDNGPHFLALRLDSAMSVLSLQPDHALLKRTGVAVGVVGPHDAAAPAAFEVRAFCGAEDGVEEDPVTGSLNAALGDWLIGEGLAPAHYTAAQGGCLARAGRVHLDREGDTLWVGGDVAACIEGTVRL
jgi:PhzF family phenazine biosynthesis protein